MAGVHGVGRSDLHPGLVVDDDDAVTDAGTAFDVDVGVGEGEGAFSHHAPEAVVDVGVELFVDRHHVLESTGHPQNSCDVDVVEAPDADPVDRTEEHVEGVLRQQF